MTKRSRDQDGSLSRNYLSHQVAKTSGQVERRCMHPRSRHNARDDFAALSRVFPVLKRHMLSNQKWKPPMPKYLMYHYDFVHPDAVYHLSKAILKVTYGLSFYLPCGCPNGACDPFSKGESGEDEIDSYAESDIVLDLQRYLSPCVPSRANYVHYAADLLHPANNLSQSQPNEIDAISKDISCENGDLIPHGPHIKALDVGTGANCIYPLLGVAEYGWSFIASDIDKEALNLAKHNLKLNNMSSLVDLRHQPDPFRMFGGLFMPNEFVHLTMCNPPFHSSMEQTNVNPRTATSGTKNELVFPLKHVSTFSIDANNERDAHLSKFSVRGQVNYTFSNVQEELGEVAFLEIMLVESRFYVHNALWFTSLVAKLSTLKRIKRYIQVEMRRYDASSATQIAFLDSRIRQQLGEEIDEEVTISVSNLHACEFRTFVLNQGRQTRWMIAWTYYNADQRCRILKKVYDES
ncbi:sam-dependent methyltransferase like protein [Babesia gibsoni]|uniref:Sam-dependent methyltransferase like protein n=1 Tax=Babesia gibsoni TaxID=33632 RepID=A0AAD8PGU8_BABGI|nr:sam-dependent methyltransferase like protein [Babesia gibsoni]